MSFGRYIANGVGLQIVNLIILAFCIGGCAAIGLWLCGSWLWEHASIVVR